MVVIVVDTVFVAGRGADRLNATDETLVQQNSQGVIYGLARNGPDFLASDVRNAIGRDVRMTGNGPHDGESLGGREHAVASKDVCGALGHVLDNIKFWSKSKSSWWRTCRVFW
jgi:hypothetical protein